MHTFSGVWKYFTPLTDDHGKETGKAKCNNCDKDQFLKKGGTTNKWRHFLDHHTNKSIVQVVRDDLQGRKKKRIMQTRCKYCQSILEDSPGINAKHVVACIEKDAAAVGTSAPPPAQPGASPGSMDMPADLGAQPSPLPSAPSRPGAGGSLSMDEPADLGAQPPPLPSAPSRPGGSSPLLGIEPAELSAQPSPLPSAPSRPSGSSSLLGIEPADLSAQPPPLPSASSTPGAGGSSSMDEPADLGAQPPLLPSAPSRRGESSSMDPEPAELRVQRLSSAPSGLDGSSSDGEEPDDMEEAKYHLAKMIALSGYDPSIVDDDYFCSFVKCLNPKFEVPSREDIETECIPIFWKPISYSLNILFYSEGKTTASFAVGKAKVSEKEVIYLAYHFIDSEWNLHKVIRKAAISSVWPGTPADIGLRMVRTVLEDVKYRTVAWGVTNDHSELKGLLNQDLPHAGGPKRRVFCTTFVDCILHSVADHLYRNIDIEFLYRNIDIEFGGEISKRAEDLEFLSRDVGRDLWAYSEAWYCWYCFLLTDSDGYEGATLDFRDLLLKFFGEIYHAIQKFCASSGPTANLCLVELINVRKFLQSQIARFGDHSNLYKGHSGFADNKDVATVVTELTGILDEAIKEWYLIWSIPLILDPRYKLNGVTSIFREAFVDEADHYVTKLLPNITELYSEYVNEEYEHEWQRQAAQAELDVYLKTVRVVAPPTEGFDILKWWKVQGSRHYPTVALMARDALAIPTCNQLSSQQTAQLKGMLRGYL